MNDHSSSTESSSKYFAMFNTDPTTASNTNLDASSTYSADAGMDMPGADKTSQSVRGFVAFFTTVFASMAAAAAVVSNDIPLMLVGL